MDRYKVYKQTGSHADVLAAVGAANVLRHLGPRIVNFEDRFEIQFSRRLRRSDIDAVDPGFCYLMRSKKADVGLPPKRILRTRTAAGADAIIPCVTTTENRLYSTLGRMNAFRGPNQIVSSFARMQREDWESRVWEGFQGRADFVSSSPLVQLFNPHAARGYALLKPSGTSRRDKTKNGWAEPFVEWLRFRGYFDGCASWYASGDLRLFCPIPADVPHAQFSETVAAFRDLNLGGSATKMDCRAVLGLTRLLIEKAQAYRRPRQWVSEVAVTHYKDMGQAHTLMAMDQLAIPDWFDLRTPQQAQSWLQTLDEHDIVLRRLNDSHSDEFMLLKQYRRTFQAQWRESIAEFVTFLAGYGTLLFKRRASGHWLLPQFTLSGIMPILSRDPHLRRIAENPGFVAVAAAVRGSTVGAQAARHNGRLDHREVRYGLLGDIRRAESLGRRELLEMVFAFVSGFNREAGKRHVIGVRAAQIRDAELEAFAAVLHQSPSSVAVGSLLCGIASCLRSEVPAVQAEPELAQLVSA